MSGSVYPIATRPERERTVQTTKILRVLVEPLCMIQRPILLCSSLWARVTTNDTHAPPLRWYIPVVGSISTRHFQEWIWVSPLDIEICHRMESRRTTPYHTIVYADREQQPCWSVILGMEWICIKMWFHTRRLWECSLPYFHDTCMTYGATRHEDNNLLSWFTRGTTESQISRWASARSCTAGRCGECRLLHTSICRWGEFVLCLQDFDTKVSYRVRTLGFASFLHPWTIFRVSLPSRNAKRCHR